jgi:hypothetical protein
MLYPARSLLPPIVADVESHDLSGTSAKVERANGERQLARYRLMELLQQCLAPELLALFVLIRSDRGAVSIRHLRCRNYGVRSIAIVVRGDGQSANACTLRSRLGDLPLACHSLARRPPYASETGPDVRDGCQMFRCHHNDV